MAQHRRGAIRRPSSAAGPLGGSLGSPTAGEYRSETDLAHATYYESGQLASATRIRRVESIGQPPVVPVSHTGTGRIVRWTMDYCQMVVGVAFYTAGSWGAWTLFGWPGLVIWLLVLAAVLNSAG